MDNAPTGALLELSLGQKKGDLFEPEVVNPLLPARQQRVGVGVRASDGGIDFDARVLDWPARFDAVPVRGQRTMRARLLDQERKELLSPVYHTISFDDQAPEKVVLLDLPKQARQGTSLTVKALAVDRGTGIDEVVFFLGQAVDNKLAPTAVKVRGQPVAGQPNIWTARPAVACRP